MNLRQIVDFLEDKNFYIQIVNRDNGQHYFPANFLNKIKNGIYHISPNYQGIPEGIIDSIIFSDKIRDELNTYIIVENPQLAHYVITELFIEEEKAYIHPTALINSEAKIGNNVSIGPYSVIGKSIIEDNVKIKSNVIILDKVVVKKGSLIDSNSNIGSDGIVWTWDEDGNRVKQHQLGGVIIGENVHLGTDVTIVRGSLSENSIIGKGSVISHGTKIGHGAIVGEMVHMANNVSLAGNTNIGDRAYLGSGVVVPSNVKVPANTVVGASALVNKNFEEEYLTLAGVPAKILYKNNFNRKGKGAPLPHKK